MITIKSKKITKRKRVIAGTLILTYASHMLFLPIVLAAPVGLSSSTPGVSFSGVGTSNTTITSSSLRSIVNAQGFDTVRGETVNVIQSNNASMLIRIGGAPTSYDGILNAMGQLILLNPNGIIFGPNAQINVGALIASSLHLTDANFLAGQYLFQGTGIEGVVRNMGAINGTSGVYLLAPNVENHGVITSPGGNIILTAGTTAYLSNRPDGNGFLAELRAPSGQALNVGQLIADGGNISMAGLVVNQNGLVQANAAQSRNGRIELIARQPDNATAADAAASVTLGAASVTQADGGSIAVNGQTVTHRGAMQANGGTVDVTATAGAQTGSGQLGTAAGSRITADGGSIRLTGDQITHSGTVQANAANGRAGSVDMRARGANATVTTSAGSRIAVNGGDVVLEGRVIDHGGAVQADAVGDRNGHVTFFGGDQLIFRSTSEVATRGVAGGVLDGGTVIGMARNTGGTVTVDPAARFDLSASPGGSGGTLWLGDRRQNLGAIGAGVVTGASQTRLIPVDQTVSDFSTLGIQHDVSLVALNDLRITGLYDLSTLPQAGAPSRLRLIAGRDLLFDNLILWNNPFATPAHWDIVGLAVRNILFTGFNGSILHTAHGGSIDLQARTGDINLSDERTGALSTVRVQGGGGISMTTGQDLKASTGFDENGGGSDVFNLFNIQGINIDGLGRLMLDVGRNFIGSLVQGIQRGPGFVLWNADAGQRPQHSVTVGGRIGDTNLPLGANGLPLTVAEQRAANPNAAPVTESSARYADFALSGGDLTVSAGGNIYLRRVQDAGLVGGLDALGNPRDPAFSAGFQNTSVTLISRDGHIILNTNRTATGTPEPIPDLAELRSWLPASFEARAENGTIQIRSDLTFLPSPAGSVKFFARQDIQGVARTIRQNNPNYEWLYIGVPGVPGGHWQAVDRTTIASHPELWEAWSNRNNLPANIQSTRPGDDTFPDSTRIDVETSPPRVRLLEVDPNSLIGNTVYGQMAPWAKATLIDRSVPLAADNTTALAQVSFTTALGNISKLVLDLVSRPFRKEVTIEAGNRIEAVRASIYIPDLGTRQQTVTEHIPLFLDPVTNQPRPITQSDIVLIRVTDPVTNLVVVRPWNGIEAVSPADIVNVVFRDVPVTVATPNVAATIKAKDFLLNRAPDGSEGGFDFYGPGTARIIATNNLDLGTGKGFATYARPDRPGERGGLLDIAVANNLDMVVSAIVSSGGSGISIHGYDENRPYVVGYDNSALYPLEFPDSARGGLNLPAAGGRINVGENSARSQGSQGRTTGIQVTTGGSVGQYAREAVVNPDGTVTVNVVRDPAAIVIRAQGDIDVNKSRIATFGGGDIRITTTHGNINSGSGSRDERVNFSVPTGAFDSDGNPIMRGVEVPGSGIFTFHPDDPRPLADLFPQFNDPEVNALLAEAARQRTFGRDVSQLEATANRLRDERLQAFQQNVLSPFIDGLRLGNVTLTAETGARAVARQTVPADGSGRIFVSEAGILGRDVTLNGVLVFRGGSVIGRVILPPTAVPQGQTSFGGLGPAGVGGGLPPLSGGGSAAAASSTAAASSSTVKNSEQVQEDASDSSTKQGHSSQVASKKDSAKEEKSQLARSVRVKRGVVIQVDVKPQQGS